MELLHLVPRFGGFYLILVAIYLIKKIAKNGVETHEHWPLALTLVMGAVGTLLVAWPAGQHFMSWFLTLGLCIGAVAGLYAYWRFLR